jgi:hypothetical protein
MPVMRRRRIIGGKEIAPTTSRSSILEEIISKNGKRTFGAFSFFVRVEYYGA